MSTTTPVASHKKSKLEEFTLGFEYNRTFQEERRFTKQRTHNV